MAAAIGCKKSDQLQIEPSVSKADSVYASKFINKELK